MRVLHLYQRFHPARGGIEDFLLDLGRELRRTHGDEHVVLTAGALGRTRVDEVEGVRVVRTTTLGRYLTPLCPTWPVWIRRLRPDVVHVHLPCPMAELAVLLAQPSRRRLIVTLHNDYVRPRALVPLWRPVHHAVLRRAQRIVTSSAPYAATSPVLRELGVPGQASGDLEEAAQRIVCIAYGLRLHDYSPPPERLIEMIRRRHRGPLIVFLGRLCYYKGVEVLIEAAQRMREQATVLIIGDGPWRSRLARQAAAKASESQAQVRFLGALPEKEVIAHLHAAELFALPSTARSEAFGLAQLKAMECGVPVVSSDLPGVAWVNRDGDTGLTVPPHDATALADAIDRLLGDPAWRERLGRGAKRRAAHLTLERMAHQYRMIYVQALHREERSALSQRR